MDDITRSDQQKLKVEELNLLKNSETLSTVSPDKDSVSPDGVPKIIITEKELYKNQEFVGFLMMFKENINGRDILLRSNVNDISKIVLRLLFFYDSLFIDGIELLSLEEMRLVSSITLFDVQFLKDFESNFAIYENLILSKRQELKILIKQSEFPNSEDIVKSVKEFCKGIKILAKTIKENEEKLERLISRDFDTFLEIKQKLIFVRDIVCQKFKIDEHYAFVSDLLFFLRSILTTPSNHLGFQEISEKISDRLEFFQKFEFSAGVIPFDKEFTFEDFLSKMRECIIELSHQS